MCAAQICLHKGFSKSAAGEKTEELATKKKWGVKETFLLSPKIEVERHILRTKYPNCGEKRFYIMEVSIGTEETISIQLFSWNICQS